MVKIKLVKITALLLIFSMLSIMIMANPVSAIVLSQNTSWFNISDTNVSAVSLGDVNGDGVNEIVSAGYFNNGGTWNAQLVVRSGVNNNILASYSWITTSDTQISAMTIGDANNDGKNEIVTADAFWDGARWNAQLVVWNGATLVVTGYVYWFTSSDTSIASVAVGDVNGDGLNELVTVGSYFDGTIWHAQLIVRNGAIAALPVTGIYQWITTSDTRLTALAIGDVNADGIKEIVTGSTFFDGAKWNAQLIAWNGIGATPVVTEYYFWTTIGNTQINSIAVGDVNGDNLNEIVTANGFYDGTNWNAQLIVWNGATLVVTGYTYWLTTANTYANSVVLGNYTGALGLDIITGGSYSDGVHYNAQINMFNGASSTLLSRASNSFLQISNTEISSVAFGALSIGTITPTNRIVTGGSFFDNLRSNAQVTIWA